MKRFTRLSVLLIALCVLLSGCISFPIDIGTTPTESTPIVPSPFPDGNVDQNDPNDPSDPSDPGDPSDPNDPTVPTDPYVGMSAAEFYANYQPATSAEDARWRSLHGFLSGSLEVPDQAPVLADGQPRENGLFVRNTSALYSEDGDTYYVVDANGRTVMEIYRGGGYITLEEVAAYLFAFGDVPANYVTNKKDKPGDSIWGIHLRLNHNYFSGDTKKYPYEPVLPDISGCGGDLSYFEVDIGTLGTDCDPRYRPYIYNDGSSITRGAARIVYTRYDANGDEIIDVNEKYLFYTYNHYNDFREYLNYFGGWGEMFGNITGGGAISSKSNYNPTPYVATARRAFVLVDSSVAIADIDIYVITPLAWMVEPIEKRRYAA